MQKEISVVIPVYNGQAYIARCVDSVLAQQDVELNRLEILLINDGSKDDSLAVLKQYQQDFPTVVKVIDQENIGAARTRNKGISLATGTYLMLIDQDDFVDQDYCKVFHEVMLSEAHDIVGGGFKLVNAKNQTVRQVMPVNTEFGKFLSIPAWAKMYRTDFLKDNKIEFFDNNIGEDSIFTTKVITCAKKYKTVQYAGYCNSFDNAANVTNTLHKGLSKSVNIIRLLDELMKLRSSQPELDKMLQYNITRTALYYLLSYGKYAKPQRFYEVYKEIFVWLRQSMPHYATNRYVWLKPKGERLTVNVGVITIMILHKVGLMKAFATIYCRDKTI